MRNPASAFISICAYVSGMFVQYSESAWQLLRMIPDVSIGVQRWQIMTLLQWILIFNEPD